MLDNIDVAIMTKLNDLAERYGLKAYDFLASVHLGKNNEGSLLTFESYIGAPEREDRYDKMLEALDAGDGGKLCGESRIIDALDTALQRTPRRSGR